MIRDVNLLEYLPPFVQEYVEMQQIMQAENPDVQKLEDETEIIKNNQFIQSCNLTGIRKFEELLKIIPSNVDTLESRRSRVLTRWNDVVPYTKQTLQQKLKKSRRNKRPLKLESISLAERKKMVKLKTSNV